MFQQSKLQRMPKKSKSTHHILEGKATSVKMIETHYGHVLLRKKAHEIAGRKYQIKTAQAPQAPQETQPTEKATDEVKE